MIKEGKYFISVALIEIEYILFKNYIWIEVFTEKPHTLAIYKDSIVYLGNPQFLVTLLKDILYMGNIWLLVIKKPPFKHHF